MTLAAGFPRGPGLPPRVALARAPAFAQRFFAAVFTEFPSVESGTRFWRAAESPGDTYATLPWPGGSAGVQIDPNLAYVIIAGEGGVGEYGDWEGDQVPPALDYLRSLIRRTDPPPEPGAPTGQV